MKNCVRPVLIGVLPLNVAFLLYSLWELLSHFTPVTVYILLFEPQSVHSSMHWIFCPAADFYFHFLVVLSAGALTSLALAPVSYESGETRFNLPLFVTFAVSNSSAPDFFSRALFSPLSSQHSQTYYALTVYFFLAFALCGLLAGLAYLFSISTAQETEKRSEYECGFAPFDSATRLPFDVHFYLVGILFLIFDVEVALLFPWVLALRTTGWFGFYLMFAFLAILTLGFLYEWKRGALIWPTRYSKKSSSAFFALAVPGQSTTFQELLTILSSWPGLMVIGIFTLYRLAIVYNWVQTKGPDFRAEALRVFWFIGATLFLCSLYCSYYLSAALALVFFVSSYLERNPFWPARAYWGAHIIIVSAPIRRSHRPYKLLFAFWGSIFALFLLLGIYWSYVFYTAPVRKFVIPNVMPLIDEFFATSLAEMAINRMDNGIPKFLRIHPAIPEGFNLAAAIVFLAPFTAFNALLENIFGFISPYNVFALLLLFWMVASTIFSYTHGWTSFVFRGVLYQKLAEDPGVSVTMAYLWKEVCIAVLCLVVSVALYRVDWVVVTMVTDGAMLTIKGQAAFEYHQLVDFVRSIPGRLTTLIQNIQETFNLVLKYAPVVVSGTWTVLWGDLKLLPAFLLRFWYVVAWILYGVRGYYYMEYIHDEEDEDTFYGSVHMILASISYTFIVPWFRICYFLAALYRRVRATLATYYTQRTAAATPEAHTQLSATATTEETQKESSSVKTPASSITPIVVDSSGLPTGEDYATALSNVTAGFKRMFSQADELASLQIYCEDLDSFCSVLILTAACLFTRGVQLAIRWSTRASIPDSASAQLIKKYTWAPRKASAWSWLLSLLPKEKVETFTDSSPDLHLINSYLAEQLSAAEQKASLLSFQLGALAFLCLCLLIVNCYLSRKCQHHEALINGILTDGALVVVTTETNKRSRATKSFLFLTASAEATELLFSPMLDELFTIHGVDYPLLAEVVLFLLICGVITKLSSDLGKDHNKRVLAHTSWKILTNGLIVVLSVYLFQLCFDASSATILGGYFATSRTIILLKLITLISVIVVLDASETFMRQHSRHLLEYPIMVVLTTFFMLLLISANHVMSTFLSLVGFSLGLYVLILYDANKRPSREAGLKYYYLSTLSSGFVLYGILLVYTITGTGNFDELFLLFNTKLSFQENALLWTAVLFILAGFFFKLSAFPGHLWAADVYEGSPSPIVAFFMLPVKIVVLAAFIRLFSIALAPLAASWLPLLTLAVIISIGWGALASVQEKKVRRFLAYASINQMGFLLMGLTTDSDEGYQAALLYITIYAVMTSAFLGVFLSARRQDGSELLYVSDFRTLASRNWLVGWSLAVVLFSMAGIPPLGGFFSKYLVLLHSFEKGLMIEVVIGLATSLISTYYYLRIIKIVKFEQPDGAMPSSPCLTARRQNQLFFAEALLWSFIVFAPAILGLTYTLALSQGPACL